MVDLNKRLIDLTAAELIEVLKLAQGDKEPAVVRREPEPGSKYAYGIAGIARIFGCGKTKANRIKQSGDIDAAITQNGRTIVTDIEKALELAGDKYKQFNNIHYE